MGDSQRLDQYVVLALPTLSRSAAVKLVERGDVTVNGQVQPKAGYKLRATDQVQITYDELAAQAYEPIELPVVYEDDDCVVIDKPAGVLTHSKGAFNPEATVATWLASRWTGEPGERGGIVHRLDRATSGIMICAKQPESMAWLQKQFGQRRVKKTYTAIVGGHLKQSEAIIDMPIERNPKRPQTFRAGSNGKSAVTQYTVEAETTGYTQVRLQPTTGRTHQLRVHMAQLGNPIIGDTLYAGQPADRLYLHATQLELTLPSRQRQTFTSPVPTSFAKKLADG